MGRIGLAVTLAMCSMVSFAEQAKYLPTIKERWNASDLVCIGTASSPVRTGITRKIDGSDRDQLSSIVELETCFKGKKPTTGFVQVIGYSVVAEKDLEGRGFAYSGPPVGFVRKGRNLIFFRATRHPQTWAVVVPIYETAIRLADNRPDYPADTSPAGTRLALTQEFEAALVQFDPNDVSDIERILDLIGTKEGIAELARFSAQAPLSVQRDIAVTLLSHDQLEYEPVVISLLTDASAPTWKRSNAARALGDHGTKRALHYLQEIAEMPVPTDDLRSLRLHAIDSLKAFQRRLSARPN